MEFHNMIHQLQKSRWAAPPVNQRERERRSMGRNLRSRSSHWQQTVEPAQCLLWMSWRPQWGRWPYLLPLWFVFKFYFTLLMSHNNIHIQILRWFPLFFCFLTQRKSPVRCFYISVCFYLSLVYLSSQDHNGKWWIHQKCYTGKIVVQSNWI